MQALYAREASRIKYTPPRRCKFVMQVHARASLFKAQSRPKLCRQVRCCITGINKQACTNNAGWDNERFNAADDEPGVHCVSARVSAHACQNQSTRSATGILSCHLHLLILPPERRGHDHASAFKKGCLMCLGFRGNRCRACKQDGNDHSSSDDPAECFPRRAVQAGACAWNASCFLADTPAADRERHQGRTEGPRAG